MTGAVEFEVVLAEHPGATVVQVAGELDLATIGRLEETLETVRSSSRLVIDLTRCTFLDSSAVRLLVSTARSSDEAGGSLSLVASDPGLLRVLEITAVDSMLPVHSSVDAAI